MSDEIADDSLDLRGVLCPINFVKTKLKLEGMADGEKLEVYLDAGEPITNVPRSVKNEGHQIIKATKDAEGFFRVIIKKNS